MKIIRYYLLLFIRVLIRALRGRRLVVLRPGRLLARRLRARARPRAVRRAVRPRRRRLVQNVGIFCQDVPKLEKARSRLYRSQFVEQL